MATSRLPAAAYVHLPFCRRRCFYCDFPVVAIGDAAAPADAAAARYVSLLRREIDAGAPAAAAAPPLASVYFGGGTPSLTPPRLLAEVVDALRRRFGLADGFECTLEMDPGTFDEAKLQAFVDVGVTRVSVGIQSFDDDLLRACGRAHNVADSERALDLLLGRASPQRPMSWPPRPLDVSIDLIGGLPGQTIASWEKSLERAATSGVHHISVYDLQIEPRTAFGKWFGQGKLDLPGEEAAADMYRAASRVMYVPSTSRPLVPSNRLAHSQVLTKHGFEHYEVSSFARPGHRSVHNRMYWRNEPFYAYGMGATSHIERRRLARPRTLPAYSKFVDRLEAEGWEATNANEGELEEGLDALSTGLMLALRTDGGLHFNRLRQDFPKLAEVALEACNAAISELPSEWAVFEPIIETENGSNVVSRSISDLNGGNVATGEPNLPSAEKGLQMNFDQRLRLRAPEGFLFSNEAISTIFARLDEAIDARGLKAAGRGTPNNHHAGELNKDEVTGDGTS